jgi:hypothetical protein
MPQAVTRDHVFFRKVLCALCNANFCVYTVHPQEPGSSHQSVGAIFQYLFGPDAPLIYAELPHPPRPRKRPTAAPAPIESLGTDEGAPVNGDGDMVMVAWWW